MITTLEVPAKVKAGEPFQVNVTVGKEIPHPNTTEHHIRWIKIFFKPDGDQYAYHVGSFAFEAHGEVVTGPNTGPVYTEPSVTLSMKVNKSGTLLALSYCNIHGLWESSSRIEVE